MAKVGLKDTLALIAKGYSKKEIDALAAIDDELFDLLQDSNVRAKLRVVLISTYLDNQPTLVAPLPAILISMGYITSLIAC